MSPFITLLTAIKKLLSFKVDRDEFREAVRETKKDIEGVKNDIEDAIEEVEGNIVQSDWNQNDESAPDHVKNRPFYEDVSLRTVICKEQTITLQDGKYSYFEYDMWPEYGLEYVVVFDGVEYLVVCRYDSDVCYRLDFTHISGIFVDIVDSSIVANGLAGEHTLAIYTNDSIKRIDTKFIPKSVLDDLESLNVSLNQKMDVRDPAGTGNLSMNRLSNTTVGACSSTLGGENRAETKYSHAEGYKTSVTKDTTMVGKSDVNIGASYNKGAYGHAEGYGTVVSGAAGHAEGNGSVASGLASHAEGRETTASGNHSHAEGDNTTASGHYAHAEGFDTTASGQFSHSEGRETTASGDYSHAEGYNTTASGQYAHAEGVYTTASGYYSHAEGIETRATKYDAHAEGSQSEAYGNHSHAEGYNTTASGNMSHSEGGYTIAASAYQHTQGKYNIEDADKKYAHIVGNGESDTTRSNAHTLDWNGLGWFKGGLKVGGTGQDDAEAKEVALKEDIPTAATENKLGTVKVSAKTDDMTQPIGADENGLLWTAPGSSAAGLGDFRLIRSVTIPEDPSADTSGVTWLARESGGYWFGFDTDSSGATFDLKELVVICEGVTSASGDLTWRFNSGATPFYGSGTTIGSYSPTENKAWQWIYFLGAFTQYIGCKNSGANVNNAQANRYMLTDRPISSISSISTYHNNGNAYGITAGTIHFYGR